MTYDPILIVCTVAVIACGLIAGVFLTFSDFVMKSLSAAGHTSGIEVMQLINRKVYGSLFMVLLIGMLVISVVVSTYAALYMAGSSAVWILAGCALYVIGVFIVTVAFNVPMNQRLDAMNSESAEAVSYWSVYASSWTLWNHVRTIASAGAAACFLIGCLEQL